MSDEKVDPELKKAFNLGYDLEKFSPRSTSVYLKHVKMRLDLTKEYKDTVVAGIREAKKERFKENLSRDRDKEREK